MRGIVRWPICPAAVNGLMAVAVGAFAAHAVADPQVKDWLRTGAQHQLAHAVAALAVGGLDRIGPRTATWVGWLFGAGGLLFASSLDLLALTGARGWGAAAPIGGLLLLAGWAVLLWRLLTGEDRQA